MTHSRVPVYEGEKTNIISMLIVKRLILLDPDDATPVKTLLSSNAATTVIYVEDNMPLYDLLNLFQTGKGKFVLIMLTLKLLFFYPFCHSVGNLFNMYTCVYSYVGSVNEVVS